MSETVTNDPTADEGPFVLNPPGVLSTGQAIPAPPPKGTAELPGKLEASEKEREAEHQQYLSDRDAATRRLHTLERQRPAIPNEQPLGKPPDWKEYQKHAMGWAGAMSMIGALAAGRGRQSGVAALSAFNGALKGWQEGNLERYVNEGERWKRESERTIENNRQLLQKYQMVMNNYRLNIDQQMAEIQRIAIENHDNIAYRLSKDQNMTALAMHQDKLDEWTNGEKGLARTTEIMGQKYDQSILQLKQTALDYGPYVGPNGENIDKFVNKDGTPWTNAQKQTLRFALEKFPPRDPALTVGRYMSPAREAISKKAASLMAQGVPEDEAYLQANEEYYSRTTAARAEGGAEARSLASALTKLEQQKAGIESFSRAAIANGRVLVDLAKKVDATGIPVFERWDRAGRQATGDPDVARFNFQINAYRADIAKIITQPNMTGVLTDTARKEVEAGLANNANLEQIEGIVDLAEGDMQRRHKGIDDQIVKTRERLHSRGGPGQSSSASSVGGVPPVPNAKQAPDGNWYVPDPNRPGKFLKVE